jgi:hypothetical protein
VEPEGGPLSPSNPLTIHYVVRPLSWIVSPRQELELRLVQIPDIVPIKSRYGHGVSYSCGGREIAHFHGDTRMDVRLTKEVIRELKLQGPLDRRLKARGPSAEWIEVHVTDATDVPYAISLVEDAVRANA